MMDIIAKRHDHDDDQASTMSLELRYGEALELSIKKIKRNVRTWYIEGMQAIEESEQTLLDSVLSDPVHDDASLSKHSRRDDDESIESQAQHDEELRDSDDDDDDVEEDNDAEETNEGNDGDIEIGKEDASNKRNVDKGQEEEENGEEQEEEEGEEEGEEEDVDAEEGDEIGDEELQKQEDDKNE